MENYWWLIPVIAFIIIILLIVLCLVWRSAPDMTDINRCRSAEYPTIAENTSNNPNVVEVTLTSSDNEVQILEGDPTKMYNYNNSFPGPLIEAKCGDLLLVHFVNDISEPSTITFHGLTPDADQDGSVLAQYPVQPGDCFTYKIRLSKAGLFYYHSDVNARRQVSMGLFGAILVHDYHEDYRYRLPMTEKVLAFSDLKLNSHNQIDIDFSKDECTKLLEELNGIQGNVLLTNGVQNGCINLSKNVPVRLRMLNAAADRFMKIFIEDHDMLKIGGDQGLSSKPLLIKSGEGLLLTPGERADVVFVPRKERVELMTELNPRGVQHVTRDDCGHCEIHNHVSTDSKKAVLVTFVTREGEEKKLEVPLKLAPVKQIPVDHCTPVIRVTYDQYAPDCEGNIEYYAVKEKEEGIPFDSLTAKQAPIAFEDGIYIIEISNYSNLPNNFHLHGFSFQHLDTWLLSRKGKERIVNHVIENKDTILIPARPEADKKDAKAKTVVRLAVDFSGKGRDVIAYGGNPVQNGKHSRSGGWVFQSNLLTNSYLGQAGYVQIVAQCHREKYLDSSVNSYSVFSEGDHSVCLTRDTHSSSIYRSSSFESDVDSLTRSLIVCSCGSGLSSSLCGCSRQSRREYLESRRSRHNY